MTSHHTIALTGSATGTVRDPTAAVTIVGNDAAAAQAACLRVARKLLRDTMTHDQRGEFINRVIAQVPEIEA